MGGAPTACNTEHESHSHSQPIPSAVPSPAPRQARVMEKKGRSLVYPMHLGPPSLPPTGSQQSLGSPVCPSTGVVPTAPAF